MTCSTKLGWGAARVREGVITSSAVRMMTLEDMLGNCGGLSATLL